MIPWPVALGCAIAAFLVGCATVRWLTSPPLITGEDLQFCDWCDNHPDALPSDCECLGNCGRRQCMLGARFTDGLRMMLEDEAGP